MKEEKVYKELLRIDDFKQFDVDQEWDSFMQKASLKNKPSSDQILDTNPDRSTPVRRLPIVGMSIAASLILLLGCMYFFNLKPETDIDPILVEDTIPVEAPPIEIVEVEQETVEPEPVIQTPEVVDNTPKREQVDQPDAISQLKNKPLVVADSPKPTSPAPEYKRYEIGELIDLSDGSTVTALTVATMSIPKSFEDSDVRNIKIRSGYAEFDVTKNEEKAFKVTTLNSEVSVLGTTFSLLSEGIETTVKTIEGLVEFYALASPDEKVTIREGEEYKFDGSTMAAIAVQEEPEVIEKERTNILKGVENLFNNSYAKVKLKRNAIKKEDEMLEVGFPERILSKPSPSNLAEIIDILNEKFDMNYEKGDCDTCYSIEYIRVKDDK